MCHSTAPLAGLPGMAMVGASFFWAVGLMPHIVKRVEPPTLKPPRPTPSPNGPTMP